MLTFNDPTLFRQQCLIGGQWVDADDKLARSWLMIRRGLGSRHHPERWALGDAARDLGGAGVIRLAARTAKERALILRRWHDLMMANPDDLALHHDGRAGQAARRSEGRDRVRAPRSSSGSPRKASASTAT